MAKTKYFVFDEELWQEGYFYHCEMKGDFLIPSAETEQKKGITSKAIYLSAPLDSEEKETVWGRLRMQLQLEGDSAVKVSYFASDHEEILFDGKKIRIMDLIADESMEISERLTLLEPFWVEERKNPTDIFLYRAKGRFLYFKIELYAYDDHIPEIQDLRIDFQIEDIMQYLPEIYRDYDYDHFTKRFLGIFQSQIYDLQEEIDEISKYLDVAYVNEEFLHWLASWMAIAEPQIWGEKKLRQLIKKSMNIYRKKGTKEALHEVVAFFTDAPPIIVETFELMKHYVSDSTMEEYRKLYGEDIYSFYILVDGKKIADYRKFMQLQKIVDMCRPVHTTAHIIALKPAMILGKHSYLEINSNVALHSTLKLDVKNATLPFQTRIFD